MRITTILFVALLALPACSSSPEPKPDDAEQTVEKPDQTEQINQRVETLRDDAFATLKVIESRINEAGERVGAELSTAARKTDSAADDVEADAEAATADAEAAAVDAADETTLKVRKSVEALRIELDEFKTELDDATANTQRELEELEAEVTRKLDELDAESKKLLPDGATDESVEGSE